MVVNDYEMVDLSHTLANDIPTYPTHTKFFQMPWKSAADPAAMNVLITGEHTGTHVDAPNHFPEGTSASVGIDKIPLGRFMGRALKVEVGPPSRINEQIGRSRIEGWERVNGISIESKDIVLLDFKWASRWQPVPQGFEYCSGWPGLGPSAVDYFLEKQVSIVGTDCISLDAGDGGGGTLYAHRTLLPNGVLVVENIAHLELLPAVSVVLALPLKISNGTGSPVRLVGIVPKDPHEV